MASASSSELRISGWTGEFVDPAAEAAFAAVHVDDDERRTRLIAIVFPVIALIYAGLDVISLSGELRALAVLTRIIQAAAMSSLLWLRPRREVDRRRHLFVAVLIALLALIADDYLYVVAAGRAGVALRWLWLYAIIFLVQLVLPLRLRAAALLAAITAIGFVLSESHGLGGAAGVAGYAILTAMVAVLGYFFAALLGRARRLEYALLHKLFPAEIVRRLRRGDAATDQVPAATVLFADIVGFTALSARLPAEELLAVLDELFRELDRLAAARGVEKIKTIGDCYMASCGVPSPRPDHAAAIADFALDVRALCEGRSFRGHRLALRIGVHSGPVIAGVIGQHRQLYDLWGETVNTASRMESHGEPGEVQVSAATASLLADTHAIRERGSIEVKGIGAMTTAFIVGRREERPAGDAPPAAGRR